MAVGRRLSYQRFFQWRESVERKAGMLRPLEDFARIAWQRFAGDRCLSIASSLAFTTLLSLVPIIVVAVTLLSAFPMFEKASVRLQAFLLANMIPESAANIATYARQLSDEAASLTAVGLVFLF